MKLSKKDDIFETIRPRSQAEAVKLFKDGVKAAGLKKGDILRIWDVLPPEVDRWARAYCSRRGVKLVKFGRSFNYEILTVEHQEWAAKRAREDEEARRAYWDSHQ